MTSLLRYSVSVVTVGIWMASGNSVGAALAQSVERSFRTGEIIAYDLVRGQPEWIADDVANLRRATWVIRQDGVLVFSPPGLRDDLFPVAARMELNGQRATFSGGRTSSFGMTGMAYTRIEGTIDFSGPVPVLSMVWGSGASSATRIMDTETFLSSSKLTKVVLSLR
jgi:hypothetical protein